MRTLFLTEGGRDRGFGHLTRCHAISQALRHVSGRMETRFVVWGDKFAEIFLSDRNVAAFFHNWQEDPDFAKSAARESELVVIDSYVADTSIYETLSEVVDGNILMLDDYGRIRYPRGMVLNPSLMAPGEDYPPDDDKEYLLGRDYAVLRKEFWDVPRKNVKKKAEQLLMVPGPVCDDFFVELLSVELYRSCGLRTQVIDACRDNLSAADMLEKIKESDICVSGGGQILTELMRTGTPVAGICLADNQKRNLEALETFGTGEYVRTDIDAPEFTEVLISTVLGMLPQEKRQAMSRAGNMMVNGKGAVNVASRLLGADRGKNFSRDLRLRGVKEEDLYDLWAWRSNPAVRKWCGRERIQDIPLDSHRQWFQNVISSDKTFLYVGTDGENRKIGQVRFDLEDSDARISVNLNPAFIGCGLGTRLIRAGSARIEREVPGIKEIRAEIRTDNIPSVKAFEKAGYSLSESRERNGRNWKLYKYPPR